MKRHHYWPLKHGKPTLRYLGMDWVFRRCQNRFRDVRFVHLIPTGMVLLIELNTFFEKIKWSARLNRTEKKWESRSVKDWWRLQRTTPCSNSSSSTFDSLQKMCLMIFLWEKSRVVQVGQQRWFVRFSFVLTYILPPHYWVESGIGTGFPIRQKTNLKLVARGSSSLSLPSSV